MVDSAYFVRRRGRAGAAGCRCADRRIVVGEPSTAHGRATRAGLLPDGGPPRRRQRGPGHGVHEAGLGRDDAGDGDCHGDDALALVITALSTIAIVRFALRPLDRVPRPPPKWRRCRWIATTTRSHRGCPPGHRSAHRGRPCRRHAEPTARPRRARARRTSRRRTAGCASSSPTPATNCAPRWPPFTGTPS